MLVLLNQYGYRGFNRFLINPSSARAAREVQWMAKLKTEIVDLVVTSKQPPRTGRVTPEQAIAAARANSRIEHLLRDLKPVRSTVEFSDQWNVWLIHFYSRDRHVAFASVSADGVVLEVAPPETDDQEHDESREDPHPRTNQDPPSTGGP